jgi:hypothetical protein
MVNVSSGANVEQKRRSTIDRLGWLCVGWLPSLAGAIALLVACVNPAEAGVVWLVALPAGFLACWGGAVILHEMGHLIAARVLGLNPFSVFLGHGPTVWDGSLFGLHWTLKTIPTTGFVRVWPVPMPLLRWRMLLMVGAGPAVNGVLAWLSASLIWTPPDWWVRMGLAYNTFPLLLPVLLINGLLFIGTMIPGHGKIDGFAYPTDGLQMIQLLLGSHSTISPGGHSRAASFGESIEWSVNWQSLVEQGKGEEMLRQCGGILNQRGLPADLRLHLLDAFATCVLMLGASDHITEADRYSEELFCTRPNEWTVKGTRGSVLIEMGELEEGEKLLGEVVDSDPLAFDRAIAASYMALAQIKRGQLEAASLWLEKARAFDPSCVPMNRFEKMLTQR